MVNIKTLSFKAKSQYLDGLALEYNKALVALENEKGAIQLENIREDVALYKVSDSKMDFYKKYKKLIDSILIKMNSFYKTIMINDYFRKKDNYWWSDLYSKSSYYRIKNNALNEFFDYFIV